ncbi:MAG: Holliday junction branch migration protein RuvA [Granulosicoccaceae bacterium]
MIARLEGKLLTKAPPSLLIDVNGVGYELEAPMSTFYNMPSLGERVVLLTHMVVREDAQLLYGFGSDAERRLFRALIKVSGIGPKVALVVLSGMSVDEFATCVQAEDAVALARLPGIGKKTAERLVIELRDKVDFSAGAASSEGGGVSATGAGSVLPEACAALEALGYKPAEALKMAKAVSKDAETVEELIKLALQRSVKR